MNMHVYIDALNIKKDGNKRTIHWTIKRNDFKGEITYEVLPTILPIDIFEGKKYKVLKIYDDNNKPYDGFACSGFIEIEFVK